MILQLQAKEHGLGNLGVLTCTYPIFSEFKATFWIIILIILLTIIPAMNCHPPYILDSLVLILLIIERNICINTRNTSSSYEISRFYVHDKDNRNYPKAGKLG